MWKVTTDADDTTITGLTTPQKESTVAALRAAGAEVEVEQVGEEIDPADMSDLTVSGRSEGAGTFKVGTLTRVHGGYHITGGSADGYNFGTFVKSVYVGYQKEADMDIGEELDLTGKDFRLGEDRLSLRIDPDADADVTEEDREVGFTPSAVVNTDQPKDNMVDELAVPDIIVEVVSDHHQEVSIGECRRQANEIYTQLIEDHGFSENQLEVVQGHFSGEAGLAEHFYVRWTPEDIDESVVLDPTVDQFTEENWYEGRSDTHIPVGEIPPVGVITPSMEIYDRYG